MAVKRINNYTFNWDRMLSLEGNIGPYLQHAHIDTPSLTSSQHARNIAILLGSYPDGVKTVPVLLCHR
ncbi:hypothetical protein EDD22DRAFT_964082 [Suillus occidentalis]|nr:hypothetical protein EDD22DRAFT_964082 [Suillus occidentalis]